MTTLPSVVLGADAASVLDRPGAPRGLLFGEKRHGQVDVLGFDPLVGASLDAAARARLDRSEAAGWRVVGIAVLPGDPEADPELLLDCLVAGDVLIEAAGRTGEGGESRATAFVHRGESLAPVRLDRLSPDAPRRRP